MALLTSSGHEITRQVACELSSLYHQSRGESIARRLWFEVLGDDERKF